MGLYTSPTKIRYDDLGGGINQGQPASAIPSREFIRIRNMYVVGSKLVKRGGTRKIASAGGFASGKGATTLFPYKKASGDWVLLVFYQDRFGRVSGTSTLQIPQATDVVLTPQNQPFTPFQYKDIVYAARPNTGSLLRLTDTSVERAGIPAPTVAPVISDGGAAGALVAANYKAVMTWANSQTGTESDPSPLSNTLALTANHQINYASLQAPVTNQVDTKRIYRTLPDQVNEYFHVVDIPAANLTYNGDIVLPQDLGDAVSFENGLPPPGLLCAVVWKERCFTTDGTSLFYSNQFNMEGYAADAELAVFPDDGHQIRGLCPYGDRLVVGKTNKTHFLLGTDRQTFQVLTLSDKHGVMSHDSMKVAEGILFWYGSGNNVYRSDGNNVVGIGDIKVRDSLAKIPSELQQQVVGAVFPQLSQYLLSIPQSDSGVTYNTKVLVYNYRSDAWTIYDYTVGGLGQAPSYISEFFDTNYGLQLYATFPQRSGPVVNENVYQINDEAHAGGLDDGNPLVAEILTKEEDGGSNFAKSLRRFGLAAPTFSQTMDVAVYRDGKSTPSASRTVTLDLPFAWKEYNLSNLGDPGSTIQLQILHSGTAQLIVEALELELEMLDRYVGQPV